MTRKKLERLSLNDRGSYGRIMSATASSSQQSVVSAPLDSIAFAQNLSQLMGQEIQTFFDEVDQAGRTRLHRLMMQRGGDNLRRILQRYYRHRSVDGQDTAGNTALHLAAHYGNAAGIEFYISRINEDYTHARDMFVITNNEGHTPADIARLRGDAVNARQLYRREFNYSPFHEYLATWFENQKKLLQPAAVMVDCQQRIMERLRQLARTILIEPSEIDDKVITILQSLEIAFSRTDRGIEARLDDARMASLNANDRRKVYELTRIGRLEWLLRDNICSELASFAQDLNYQVDEEEKRYDKFYEAKRRDYEERMRDFSEGDEGYDYDGPIVPKPPKYRFNRATRTEELQAEIDNIDFTDLEAVLAYVPVKEGLMGQMLYDAFIGMDMAEDLIEHLNQSALGAPPVFISSLITSFDFQFSDMDICHDGFLIQTVQENFAQGFAESFRRTQSKHLALDFIETCGRTGVLVQDIRLYNQAAKEDDALTLQKVWILMQPCITQFIAEKTQPTSRLRRSLSTEFTTITQKKNYVELSKKTQKLIKVFPSDESRTLYFTGERGHRLNLDLKPLFKTLRTIAEATHKIIVKYSQSPEDAKTTNVITAYLMLVVTVNNGVGKQQKFIRVPLVLHPEKSLLSKDIADGIFASEHEFHSSTGEDRQQGANIAHREPNTPNAVSAGEIAKQKILRLTECMDIPPTKKQELMDLLETAQIDKPVQLDYELLAPVQQSTAFNHSERVIFKALKMPANVSRIVQYLYNECLRSFEVRGAPAFKIELGCLILYSYPNSVCDECGLGVLALQNSEQAGFVQLLRETLGNFRPSSASSSVFRPTFTVSTEEDDSELHIATIVASERPFRSDPYASILKTYPTAKMDHYVDGPGLFSTPGISLSFSSSTSHFCEFVETDLSTVEQSIPYGGSVTMSGSKVDKLRPQHLSRADEEAAAFIAEYDGTLPRL